MKIYLIKLVYHSSQLQKLDDSQLIDFDFQSHTMHIASLYFGCEFQCLAKNIDDKDLTDVRERCKKFLCCLADEIQKRLPENSSILKLMTNLHPKVAWSQVKPNIGNIVSKFHREHVFGNKTDIELEWAQLQNKSWNILTNSAELYSEVYEDCDAAGSKRFGNIAKFALALLTSPVSNASVERAFSIHNVIKNKLRSRLSLEMLQSLMMVRSTLHRVHGSCVKFNPSSTMLKMFNVKMYDFKYTANCNTDAATQNDSDALFEIINLF